MKDSTRIYLASFIVFLWASFFGIYNLIDIGIFDAHYIFSPSKLHALAIASIEGNGNNTRAIVANIVSQLQADPDLAPYLSVKEEWMFNNAGGAMGAMYLIHASITEYLIIFGTPLGTEGHSGRHTADDYFHILTGTELAFSAGSYEPEIYSPGSVHHLRRGEVKQYRMPEGCFALEYARGFIPGMLMFGYADGLTSTMDLPTLWTTTRVTGREMLGNLVRGKL
ncbi:C-8 sterol isomerase [Saxophila tyrrhenica]|uniref:C-8 sterol isomerase n=1 Tax=Saxophila tyrrhenica TaxID=1690608 RepID=A0AAV9PAC5_9PEZI|nr:C-8 sterol isomerase [Saxophila tyrrhenica]